MEIKIFYLSYCPYSKKALDLLKAKKVSFQEEVCDKNKEELKKKHWYSTFPQIFIEGKMIGGYTELTELDKQGFFESKDTNLLIDKVQLGKITESMRHVLLAQNYLESGDKKAAEKHLQESLRLFENKHAQELLKECSE